MAGENNRYTSTAAQLGIIIINSWGVRDGSDINLTLI